MYDGARSGANAGSHGPLLLTWGICRSPHHPFRTPRSSGGSWGWASLVIGGPPVCCGVGGTLPVVKSVPSEMGRQLLRSPRLMLCFQAVQCTRQASRGFQTLAFCVCR